MADQQVNEALEKLNQGKTKQMFQPQTIDLAQEYSGKAIEMFKRQLKERCSALEDFMSDLLGRRDRGVRL